MLALFNQILQCGICRSLCVWGTRDIWQGHVPIDAAFCTVPRISFDSFSAAEMEKNFCVE